MMGALYLVLEYILYNLTIRINVSHVIALKCGHIDASLTISHIFYPEFHSVSLSSTELVSSYTLDIRL